MNKFQPILQKPFLKNTIKKSFFALTILLMCVSCKDKQLTSKTLLFVGSYTDKKPGEGIHVYEFDIKTGKATLTHTINNITNTSFQRVSPNGKYLYSVVESQMKYNGKVAAFKVDVENASLDLINMQDCGGLNPAHLAIDNTGSFLVNSNYSDGTLSLFKIKDNGGLSENTQVLQFKDSSIVKVRQEASHMHSSNFLKGEKYVFAFDLGADKIRRFELVQENDNPLLQNEKEIQTKLGSGPRHFSFHPNSKFGYLVNELSGKIDAYQYENGDLIFIEDYLSYSKQQDIYRTADIHISPDGKFLYVSNRGPEEDSITVFQINTKNGKLTLVERMDTGGKHPRNFAIDPSGNFLLVGNMHTNNVVVFKRDVTTGKLTKLDEEIKVKSPSSIQLFTY